jgi:acetyltransferase-like isoleucine patch superfamily enzyme
VWPVRTESSNRRIVSLLDVTSRAFSPIFRFLSRPCFVVRDWYCLTYLRAILGEHVPADLQLTGLVRLSGTHRVNLGARCRLGRNIHFDTVGGGHISIGKQVTLNNGVFLVSHSGISLGDRCLVGEYVSIRDADHGIAPEAPPLEQQHTSKPIRIGSDVWIGRGAVILQGVSIGDGAVVGANAVVTKDVVPGAVVGGVPAKVIRNRFGS